METLKFTIITPSFNQGNFIEETIRSVVEQQYKNFEYFVIDGGSNDNTIDILKKYDRKISFWVSEKDNGQSHALNKGFQRATGDVLIWINSDDVLETEALTKVSKFFIENPSVDVVHGRTILFQGTKQVMREADGDNLPEQYLSGMAFPQPSAFIRRKAIQKFYPILDETLHFGMDYDLFSCLFLNCNFLSVHDAFSKYRLHAESKTVMTNEGFARDWQKVFCKIIASLGNKEIQSDLQKLGMWHNVQTIFPVIKYIDGKFLLKSFQYFLNFQINFYYRDLNLKQVKRIAKFINREFPEFYKERNIKRLHLISSVPFARYLIPLLRKPVF